MYFFTADEHYGHAAAIKYNNRPFASVEEMDAGLIRKFNEVVSAHDTTIHAGDFCWLNKKKNVYETYVKKLNGNHLLLVGSHDHWQPDSAKYIWRKRIDGILVVVGHYAMRTWECSHYNSWQLFGHSHGRLVLESKQYDVGVDNNNYYPVSFDQIKKIMESKPDNPGSFQLDNAKEKPDKTVENLLKKIIESLGHYSDIGGPDTPYIKTDDEMIQQCVNSLGNELGLDLRK